VLIFTLSTCVFAGLVFGVIPAFRVCAGSLSETLKEGNRSMSSGVSHQRLRSLLVISETALTVVLLVGAGLLLKSFFALQNVPLGFRAERLLTARIVLPSKYATPPQKVQFQQQLLESARGFPGVQSAATTSLLPMASGSRGYGILIDGQGDKPAGMTGFRSVSADYFNTMGITLLRGRAFTDQDNEQGLPVAVINEAMAKEFWPHDDPIGKRIRPTASSAVWSEIVGIAGSVRHASVAEEPKPEMFVPNSQSPAPQINLVLRTATDSASMAGLIRQAVTTLDKDLPVYEIRTMEQRLSESVAQPRFRTLLFGIFAALALLMAVVGIYGVISYSVAQRTHEIGVRMALGVQHSNVLGMVVSQGMKLSLVGVFIGLGGAVALTRALKSFLYEVTPTDPATHVSISVLLLGVSLLACVVPARRAAKVDPMEALRYE
jgi:predicted permease